MKFTPILNHNYTIMATLTFVSEVTRIDNESKMTTTKLREEISGACLALKVTKYEAAMLEYG